MPIRVIYRGTSAPEPGLVFMVRILDEQLYVVFTTTLILMLVMLIFENDPRAGLHTGEWIALPFLSPALFIVTGIVGERLPISGIVFAIIMAAMILWAGWFLFPAVGTSEEDYGYFRSWLLVLHAIGGQALLVYSFYQIRKQKLHEKEISTMKKDGR